MEMPRKKVMIRLQWNIVSKQERVKTLRAIMVEFLLPRIDFVIILDVIEGIRSQYSKTT